MLRANACASEGMAQTLQWVLAVIDSLRWLVSAHTLYDCCVYGVPFDMTTRLLPLVLPAMAVM